MGRNEFHASALLRDQAFKAYMRAYDHYVRASGLYGAMSACATRYYQMSQHRACIWSNCVDRVDRVDRVAHTQQRRRRLGSDI